MEAFGLDLALKNKESNMASIRREKKRNFLKS
jgi:hypothetical protein